MEGLKKLDIRHLKVDSLKGEVREPITKTSRSLDQASKQADDPYRVLLQSSE